MLLIEWDHLVLARGKKALSHPFSGEIKSGEKWWVSGWSGSGKSTFLDVLAGRLFPYQGKIRVHVPGQVQLVERDYRFDRWVRQSFLYYQQRYQSQDAERAPKLWEVLQGQVKPLDTVDDRSIDLPSMRFDPQTFQAGCDLFQLNHLLHHPIVSLSNGETRRALLALSWMRHPKVLLLDQPFVGLDVPTRQLLKETLSTLSQAVVLICDASDRPTNFDQEWRFDAGKVFKNPTTPLEEPPKRTLPDLSRWPRHQESYSTIFQLTNVKVQYGEKSILQDIHWTVKPGETWALLGANGSGKSTLLSLLAADHPQAYQNDITLFDRKRGTGESIWDIKKRIGLVSPEIHLFVDKSSPVWKIIGSGFFDATGLYRSLSGEQKDRIQQVATWVSLENKLSDRLQDLSQSEQRLALLARALVKNPEVLILDEPCQGLDHSQMTFFRDLVSDITLKLNKTLIYVSHYAEEIPACVQHELVLGHGKIEYKGFRRI